MKKTTVNGIVTLHQHYLYRGYLQIAALDLTRSNAPALWLLHWDPTQPVATRPLSLRKNGTWYTYGHDLTKNVMELYKADGTIATAYDYTPYGSVTATGIDQPIQWSSEHYDPELALVYYNYRHYNPADGRWINRDPIAEEGGRNLYGFVRNRVTYFIDRLGENRTPELPKLVPLKETPEALVDSLWINCIGFATGLGVHLEPAPNISMDELFKALGWSCSPMKNGKCDCDCETEEAMVIFVYIMRPKYIVKIDREISRKEELEYFYGMKGEINTFLAGQNMDIWKSPWRNITNAAVYNGHVLIDFHGLRRNCKEKKSSEKAWMYVPQYGRKGDASVAVQYRKAPNYFSVSEQILTSQCCKKQKK